jgi:signal transduction histidine kinase
MRIDILKNYVIVFFIIGATTFAFCWRYNLFETAPTLIDEKITIASNTTLNYKDRCAANADAFKLALRTTNESLKGDYLVQIGNLYYLLNDAEKVLLTARSLQKVTINNSKFLPHLHLLYGRYYMSRSQNELALSNFTIAHEYFQDRNDEQGLTETYLRFAELYGYTSNFVKSEIAATLALKYARKGRSVKKEYLALAWMGMAANNQAEYYKAIEYNQKALKLLRGQYSHDTANTSHCLATVGYSYLSLGKLSHARLYSNEALKILANPAVYPELYSRILDQIALLNQLENANETTEYLLNKSDSVRKVYNTRQGENYNYLYISKLYKLNCSNILAQNYALKALNVSREFKCPHDILASLKQVIDVDSINGYQYLSEYKGLSDSLRMADNKIKNKFASIEYETEELTIAKEAAVNLSWWIMGGSSSLLCVGSLFLLVIVQRNKKNEFKSKKQQQKLEEELFQTLLDQQIAYEQERQAAMNKVAMDLHDSVMNKLTSTRLNLFPLNRSAGPEALQKCIMFIKSLSNIEADIYQVAAQLGTEIESPEDFISSVEKIVGDFKNISTANVSLDIYQVNWETLQQTATSHLLNIIRETLYNTHKYANASELYISAMRLDKEIIFTIKDNGCGFSTDAQTFSGIGINNMRSRMELAGGSYEILSSHGKGTTTILRLPAT